MLEFRVLGPVEAVDEGQSVPLPAEKPRALLAILLLNRNRVVSVGVLVDGLWGEEAPETATKALQVYVSQLRKAIGADRLLTKAPGYSLRVEEGELDLDRFERLLRESREQLAAGDAKGAARGLEQALELWRGPPFAEFDAEPFARDARARLEEARLEAIEERIEADLALGRHARLVPELEALVADDPLRERLRGQLMLALYRSGRQAEALELYRRTRETLVDELGIEPGPELQQLEQAILRHDPDLQASRRPALAAEAAVPPRRSRQLVAAALALVVLGAAVVGLVLTNGGGSSGTGNAKLRAFVSRMENFLDQSRGGRQTVAATIEAAGRCELGPRAAAVRLNHVQRNRQSLLQQIAALSVPNQEQALKSSDLLQKALQASIAADWHYRDWLVARTHCGQPGDNSELVAARVADRIATRAKQAFVDVFNPLARRLRQKVWAAPDF